jgi:hypothetical protein
MRMGEWSEERSRQVVAEADAGGMPHVMELFRLSKIQKKSLFQKY